MAAMRRKLSTQLSLIPLQRSRRCRSHLPLLPTESLLESESVS
jgi:hypothetical protein